MPYFTKESFILVHARLVCACTLCKWGEESDERWLGLALRVSKIDNERQVAVVDSDAGDIDDAGNALLGLL